MSNWDERGVKAGANGRYCWVVCAGCWWQLVGQLPLAHMCKVRHSKLCSVLFLAVLTHRAAAACPVATPLACELCAELMHG